MSTADANTLDFPIAGAGPLSQACQLRGYRRFAEVAEAVRMMPYGRVRDPQDVLTILQDQKGTCSAKHRFLAALAHECGHTEVLLMLGLYEMSDQNTPGVGPVLQAECLTAVPEAHCYLMREGQRYDFTGLPAGTVSPFASLVEERAISPSDHPSEKAKYHRTALASWAQARGIDAERAWAVREKCIELLAITTPHADARDVSGPASVSGARAGGRER